MTETSNDTSTDTASDTDKNDTPKTTDSAGRGETAAETQPANRTDQPEEFGGQKGPEPTRYGDWEKNGIISDF